MAYVVDARNERGPLAPSPMRSTDGSYNRRAAAEARKVHPQYLRRIATPGYQNGGVKGALRDRVLAQAGRGVGRQGRRHFEPKHSKTKV